jgi:hypothetical protein
VAAATQIRERADRVERDRLALGNLARQLDFVWVGLEALDRTLARRALARHLVIRRYDLVHARLQPLEIFGRKRDGAIEIVVEPVRD